MGVAVPVVGIVAWGEVQGCGKGFVSWLLKERGRGCGMAAVMVA